MTDGTSTTSNDAMVLNFLGAWERRATEYIVDHLTDDAVYHNIPLPPIVGKPAYLDLGPAKAAYGAS
jgi:limonene-1,2-epoxide hydrolase